MADEDGHNKGQGFHWESVSGRADGAGAPALDFAGKLLSGGRFAGENLAGANFSMADLSGADFSKADLSGADLSGANLSGANLEEANLDGAVLSGAQLSGANLSRAKMRGVRLADADLTDAILLDIDVDNLTIAELQELVEYLAAHFPHKLNLARMNLALLDLRRIDLREVSLRGADFTGVDFTGVNIMELDLSETNITPQQVAQALGRVPSADELARIMAPKKKKPKGKDGIDFSELFIDNGKAFGVLDATRYDGLSIAALVAKGGRLVNAVRGGRPGGAEEASGEGDGAAAAAAGAKDEAKGGGRSGDNAELRHAIEERKKIELQKMKYRAEREAEREAKKSLNRERGNRLLELARNERGRERSDG